MPRWPPTNAGDDAESLRRVRQILFVARANYQQSGLIGHLIADGISATASGVVHEVSPDLSVGPAGSARPASTQQVRDLIADLLDERAQRISRTPTAQFERILTIEFARVMAGRGIAAASTPRGGNVLGGYIFAPFAYRDARHCNRLLGRFDRRVAGGHRPGVLQSSRHFARTPIVRLGAPTRFYTSSFPPTGVSRHKTTTPLPTPASQPHSPWQCAFTPSTTKADFPPTLSALTPMYLPCIPDDPLAASARLCFAPDTTRIYSVGPNGNR